MPAPWLSPIGARTRPCSSSLVSPGDSALHSSILGKNVSRKECALPHCSLQDGLPVSPSGLVLSRWRADSSPKMGVPCGLSVSGLTRSLPARTHRCAPKSSDKHLPIPAERTDLPGEKSATCQARLPPIAATSPSVGNLTGPMESPRLARSEQHILRGGHTGTTRIRLRVLRAAISADGGSRRVGLPFRSNDHGAGGGAFSFKSRELVVWGCSARRRHGNWPGSRVARASRSVDGDGVHELANNAAKYGALSSQRGRVLIRWYQQSNGDIPLRLVLEWRDIGGPQVVASSKSGYGTYAIRELIPYEFGGSVDHRLGPEGARCRVELPATWLSTGEGPGSDLAPHALNWDAVVRGA